MKHLKKILSFLLCLAMLNGLVSLLPAPAVKAVDSVEVWKRIDITLTSSKTYTNAYTDVEINAVFTHTDGTTISIPGFWNGGSQWKVRFSPTKTGTWSYVVTCSDTTNTGLHNITGSLNAVANTGTTDLDIHGDIKISSNSRYFTYDDGTPFYWLGDTQWQALNYVAIDKCNYPGCDCGNQFTHEVNDRLEKGFTVYQTYFDGAESDGGGQRTTGGQPSYWTTQYTLINPTTFTDKCDVMFDYLAEHGMVIALGLGVHTSTTGAMSQTDLLRYTRYIVARYASYPIVWITGQEIDMTTTSNPTSYTVWKSAAALIDQLDGYQHPLSGHMTPQYASSSVALDMGSQSWHEWWALQAGHDGLSSIKPQSFYSGYWNNTTVKPYVETEAQYEDLKRSSGGTNGYKAARVIAWKANQCGSYGFTYGAVGIWANSYSTAGNTGWATYNNEPWYMGLDKPASFEMTYLKNFYQYVGFYRMIPRFNSTSYCNFTDEKKVISSSADNKTYVVYFYNENLTTGELRGLNSGETYSAKWYNPRTGKFVEISSNISVSGGVYTIPEKPDGQDWTLLVTSESLGAYSTESAFTDLAPTDTRTNLALNKTVTASSYNGATHVASMATDGSMSTYWCASSGTFPQWIQVDLGSVQDIQEVVMYCYYTSPSYYYTISGSTDGQSWTTVVDRDNAKPEVCTLDRFCERFNGSYRYLKISIEGTAGLGTGNWATMYELQVYDSLPPVADITGERQYPISVSCAGSGIYDASQNFSDTVNYLFDDNLNTQWVPFAAMNTQTILMDLGCAKALTNLTITPGTNATLPGFRVMASNDNENWTVLAERGSQSLLIAQLPGQSAYSVVEALSGSYRYVKLLLYGLSSDSAIKTISDLGLYATDTRTNLASGATVSAGSYNSQYTTPEKAVDGSFSTYWCASSGAFPQWYQIDLGDVKTLGEVEMYCYYTSPNYYYTLEGSVDGTAWTNIADRNGIKPKWGSLDRFIERFTGSYRYLKITIEGTNGLGTGNWATLYEVEVYEDSRTNFALNKTATAGSYNSQYTVPAKAVDGSLSTYWCASSGTFPQWFMVDLGQQEDIGEVAMYCYYSSPSYSYILQGSCDGSTWITLASRTGQAPLVGEENLDMLTESCSGSYRYIKVTINATGANWATLYELKVYEDRSINFALNKTATAGTYNGSHTASMAVDGSFSTYWCASSGAFPQWFTVDLGQPEDIDQVIMYCHYTSPSYSYTLQGSCDGSTWTTLVTRTGQAPLVGGGNLDMLTESCSGIYRYVKVTINATGASWATLYEFKVLG